MILENKSAWGEIINSNKVKKIWWSIHKMQKACSYLGEFCKNNFLGWCLMYNCKIGCNIVIESKLWNLLRNLRSYGNFSIYIMTI